MKDYSVDFDFPKQVLMCKGVVEVQYRLSASGQGFHFWWKCIKRTCKRCAAMEKKYDDQKRYRHDQKRPKANRRILWDKKGGRTASAWRKITKTVPE